MPESVGFDRDLSLKEEGEITRKLSFIIMLIIFATALTRVVYQPFIVHEQQLEWMQGSRDMIAIKRIKISEIFWEGRHELCAQKLFRRNGTILFW